MMLERWVPCIGEIFIQMKVVFWLAFISSTWREKAKLFFLRQLLRRVEFLVERQASKKPRHDEFASIVSFMSLGEEVLIYGSYEVTFDWQRAVFKPPSLNTV